MKEKSFLLNQRGGASLLAVAFTSLLITVIVIAMASLMSGELRQAIDAESSIKAYYQGESATEEASAYLVNRLNNGSLTGSSTALNQSCLPPTPSQFRPSASILASITCVRILAEGKLPPLSLRLNDPREQTKEFDLTGLIFDTIDITWGIDTSISVDATNEPLLEATMTNYPPDKKDSNTSLSTLILDPSNPANCAPGTDPCLPATPFYYAPSATAEPLASDINAKLSRLPTGQLHAVLTRGTPVPALAADYNSVLRIRTRKNSATFQLKLYQGGLGGTEITAIPLPNAVIDVTARVANTNRRIQRELPLRASPFPGLSDVIYSDTSICKDITLLTGPGTQEAYLGTCPIQ